MSTFKTAVQLNGLWRGTKHWMRGWIKYLFFAREVEYGKAVDLIRCNPNDFGMWYGGKRTAFYIGTKPYRIAANEAALIWSAISDAMCLRNGRCGRPGCVSNSSTARDINSLTEADYH